MSGEALNVAVSLEISGFRLELNEAFALDGVTAVFGPSGGGKSTLLRAIAGFERPRSGSITCGAEVWFHGSRWVPPHRRPVGLMFQDARLFTHLDVAGNLDYAVRRRRRDLEGMNRARVIETLDLESLLDRNVTSLSGGETQRVALGRTLLGAPRVLLLDEPLAGLDRQRKIEILPYLEALPGQFGIPTLFVSHDIDEVAQLADRVLVLADGRAQAHGPTATVLERFDLEPVLGRFEAGVVLEGRVAGHDARLHLTRVALGQHILTLPMRERLTPGTTVRLRVRARDVALATRAPEGLSIRNILPGTLTELVMEHEAGAAEALIDIGTAHVRARLTLAAVEDLVLEPGSPVFALIKSVSFDVTG